MHMLVVTTSYRFWSALLPAELEFLEIDSAKDAERRSGCITRPSAWH